MDRSFVFAQALSGLTAAMFLFLIASGLSLIFGVLRVLNFAHGSFYMLGAYGAYQFVQWIGTGPGRFWLAALGAALGVAILGGLVERFLFQRLYGKDELYQLLFTYALVLILSDVAKIFWGTQQKSVSRPPGLTGAFSLFGTLVPYYNLFILLLGPAIALAFWFVLQRTRVGRFIRAAALDRETLGALGRQREPPLHRRLHARLVPGRARRRAGHAGADHRARHGHRDDRRGLHRGGDRRARLLLGHVPRRRSSTGRCCPSASCSSPASPSSRCSSSWPPCSSSGPGASWGGPSSDAPAASPGASSSCCCSSWSRPPARATTRSSPTTSPSGRCSPRASTCSSATPGSCPSATPPTSASAPTPPAS